MKLDLFHVEVTDTTITLQTEDIDKWTKLAFT
jgi:hypothetical protein